MDSLVKDSDQQHTTNHYYNHESICLQEEFQWIQKKAEKQTETGTTKETQSFRDHFIKQEHQWQKES